MAEVSPIPTVHYDLDKVGPLADVVAPPYDVIDDTQRAELATRSPYNVVELDLPRDPAGGDPYEHAAELLEQWTAEGVLTRDSEPTIWALEQDYTAPDGSRLTRRAFLARVKLAPYGEGIRPHERTQPGPKEDRLRLTRATRHNLSPIFSLHPGNAWQHLEPALGDRWDEVTDADGTTHRIWRIDEPEIHRAITEELAPDELLIADGHHRYETSLAYQREVGEGGPADYVLMALVSLEDPGLTVFPTHRLISGLADDPARQEALGVGLRELFDVEEVPTDQLDPADTDGVGVFGYIDSHFKRGFRLRLKDTGRLDQALADRSPAYRQLDAAILEELVLKGTLGMDTGDIAAKRGIGYTPSIDETLAKLDAGDYQAAFILRPTPVEQVREVAAEGETMPPKSTYFFPKLLTGLAFNPLA
ncbi:MAG TPA: DUF1015 domain-containing protein [Solirubrobacterales bacterium]|nr:DUF1015 domain-containing protein [Solirubrobacterales bacterium]